ncbi:hypothetical protein [Parvibaculum sp.]|uniref:hypothetical protein n=1 Tax=Parvibaculum sp. TaxID=2024848 RepID=UPI00260024EF|nr:hypothetical protein [Parvibaculum sp.]
MVGWARKLALILLLVVTLALAAFALFVILENTRPLHPEKFRDRVYSALPIADTKDLA